MVTLQKALRDEILPYGLAMCILGVGTLVVMALSLAETDVSYARTAATALTAMCLSAVAIVVYAIGRNDDPALARWWRAFWTAGFAAYLLHFWWAVFRTYNGDFGAVLERQQWAGYINLLTTALWAADVIAAWVRFKLQPLILGHLHDFVWLVVTASFVFAAGGRSEFVQYFGYALALVVGGILFCRFRRRMTAIEPPDSPDISSVST